MPYKHATHFSVVIALLGESATNLTYTLALFSHKKDTGILFSFQPNNKSLSYQSMKQRGFTVFCFVKQDINPAL